jgi:SAM-dependent methyltransferase
LYELRDVDPTNALDVETAARLHHELFRNTGPIAQLGEFFLRRSCYGVLLRDGLIRAGLATADGAPVGLVAYTARSVTLHRTAIRRHWGYMTWLVVLSVLHDPRVLFRLPKAARLMFSRRREQHLRSDPAAEVLAIGVLPEPRHPASVGGLGHRMGAILLRHAATYFERAGLSRMRVITDAHSARTILRYHDSGTTLESRDLADAPLVELWLELHPHSVSSTPELPPGWVSRKTEGAASGDSALARWATYWEGLQDSRRIFRAEAQDSVRRLETAVPLDRRMRVLDFGCGFGLLADALAPKVGELFLWDAAANMRRQARVNVADRQNVRFLDVPAETGRYAGCFDVILVHSVVQYLTADQLSLWLARWRDMLAPRGRIVISDLLPPGQASVAGDLRDLSVFSARQAFLGRAIRESLGELTRYWGARTAYPLLEVGRDDLERWAAAAALRVEFLAQNLTYKTGRATAVLRRAAAPASPHAGRDETTQDPQVELHRAPAG